MLLAVVSLGVVQPWPEPPSDAALMERLARKEPDALGLLYDRYSRPVYSLVLRITQQSTVAEEIVQDVFLQLWRQAARYQAVRGPLQPWLFTLARNRALDSLRLKSQKQRQREDSLDLDPPLTVATAARTSDPQPEERIDQERRSERVRSLMTELPEPQRRSIELAFFNGLSHSEIAAALDQPLGTVKSWIRNGLLSLRQALEGQ